MKNFNEYVEKRDLNEGLWGYARKAGRYLGNVANSMVGSNIKVRPGQNVEAQPQKQKVGFNASDILKVKESMRDYVGLLSRFIRYVINQVNAREPHSGTSIRYAYDQSGVQAAYTELQKWYKWIDERAKEAQMQKSEWVIEEGIRVNYKNFEQMQKAMQQMVATMRQWVGQFPKLMKSDLVKDLKSIYDQNVVLKQGDLARNFLWLNQKVQELMQSRGVNYQGVETGASQPSTNMPAQPVMRQAARTLRNDQDAQNAYGQKLYQGMASQATDAKAINNADQQRYGQKLYKGIASQGKGY